MSFLSFLLLLAFHGAQAQPYELPETTLTPKIDFSAEHLEYDRGGDLLKLRGSVRLVHSTATLKAQEVDLDLKTNLARASESVALEDGRSVVFADEAEVDLARRRGRMKGVSAGVRPWYIQARSMDFQEGRQVYSAVRLTSCNLVPEAHYEIGASRLTLYPGSSLWIRNAVFYVGGVPGMYLPVFYRSLRKGRAVSTSFRFGYDERNGLQFKTATLLRLHPFYYSRLYLDYFGLQGLGTGLEANAERPGGRGTLYAYRIGERTTRRERWTLSGSAYESLGSAYSAQARLQLMSEPDFNAQYLRSSSFQVAPEIVNSAALTRRTPRTTMRVSYARQDNQNPLTRRFNKTQESLPRVDFLTAPFGVRGLPFLHSLSAFADNALDPASAGYRKTAQARYEIVQGYRLRPRLSLTPRLHASETYHQELSTGTGAFPDALVGRYGSDLNLRWSHPLGETDLGHRYAARLRPDSRRQDRLADDRGVEENRWVLGHALRPDRGLLLRLDTGYEMRSFRSRSLTDEERVAPLGAELQWRPRGGLHVYAREEFQLGRGSRSFFFQGDYSGPTGNALSFGLSESDAAPGRFFVHPGFTWLPLGRSWRLSGVIRFEVQRKVHAFDKVLTLNKDFHDFATQWQLRSRQGNSEVNFRIHLKVSAQQRAEESDLDREREFYPWRTEPEGR